jgi:polysaccharide biosynthesis/export protein
MLRRQCECRKLVRFSASLMAGLVYTLLLGGCGAFDRGDPTPNMIAAAPTAEDVLYVINPGDELQISVWREEGLDQKVLVRPDGMISFPLAGHIRASGQTTQRIEAIIKARLARYIENPQVNVSVVGTPGYRIYIVGQVQRPGPITGNQPLTVMQALALAGGFTPFADEDSLIVIRKVAGKQRFMRFNYTRAKRGVDLEQNFTLQSGDTIVVRE